MGALAAYASYRIWQVGLRDDARPADAIVVLGAAQYDGTPSPVFESRLRHAVALFDAGVAPRLVVTGGGQPGDRTTEAAVGRAYALSAGVPDEAILVEDTSRNTLESLEAVAGMLQASDATTVVLVSDRTHMLRALRMATDLGLRARPSPATDSPTEADARSRTEAMLHELAALLFYFTGFQESGVATPPDTSLSSSSATRTSTARPLPCERCSLLPSRGPGLFGSRADKPFGLGRGLRPSSCQALLSRLVTAGGVRIRVDESCDE